MGFMDLFSGVGTTLANAAFNQVLGLSRSELQQNEFNAYQAEVNRLFQSTEAQKNRDFNQNMAETAYQRQVSDMKRAGLNPALAMGHSSPMSASSSASPSGSAASAGSPNNKASAIASLVMAQKEMKLMNAQIRNVEADTAQKLANADKTSVETSYIPALSESQINKIRSEIDVNSSVVGVNASIIDLNGAKIQTELTMQDANVARSILDSANTRTIDAVRDLQVSLMSAQTEAQRASASLNFLEYAIKNDRSVIDAIRRNYSLTADNAQLINEANELSNNTAKGIQGDKTKFAHIVDLCSRVTSSVGNILGGSVSYGVTNVNKK